MQRVKNKANTKLHTLSDGNVSVKATDKQKFKWGKKTEFRKKENRILKNKTYFIGLCFRTK